MTKHSFSFASRAALALTLGTFATACDTMPSDPFAAAQQAYADGEIRTALEYAAAAADADPSNIDARMLAGDMAMALNQADRAITEYEAIANDPQLGSLARAKLAEAQLIGNYRVAAVETIETLTMDNSMAYVASIVVNMAEGNRETALAQLTEGLEKYPEDARLITFDAERLVELSRRDEAQERLAPVLKRTPAVPEAHLLAGRLQLTERDPNAAQEHFKKVLTVRPLHQTAMLALAAISRDKGDMKAASNWINKVNDAGDPHPIGLLFAAQMAYDAGEISRAFELIELAPPVFAERPEFARVRGMIDAARGQHGMAAMALQDYVDDTQGDPLARHALANAYAKQGQFKDAWKAIEPVIDHPQADGPSLILALKIADKAAKSEIPRIRERIAKRDSAANLSEPLREASKAIRAGDWAKADSVFAPLVDGAGKNDAVLLNNAAAVKTKLGKHSKAVELARRAHEQAPQSAEIMDTLGWALWQQGSAPGEARDWLSKARAKAPANRQIGEHWAIAHAKS